MPKRKQGVPGNPAVPSALNPELPRLACQEIGLPNTASIPASLFMLGLAARLIEGRGSFSKLRWDGADILADGCGYCVKLLSPNAVAMRGRGRPRGTRGNALGDLKFARDFVVQQRLLSQSVPIKRELRASIRSAEENKTLGSKARGVNFDRIQPLVENEWFSSEPTTLGLEVVICNEIERLCQRQQLAFALIGYQSRSLCRTMIGLVHSYRKEVIERAKAIAVGGLHPARLIGQQE